VYGFAPILWASTAMAMSTETAINTKTTTKISSFTRSDDERKDAEEMANDAVERAWADVKRYSAAIQELDQDLEEWIESNPSYLEDKQLKLLYTDKKQDVKEADERLDEARAYHLQARDSYWQLTRSVADLYANDIERRTQKLMGTLEWREPKRLCESLGRDWSYQAASELVDTLEEHIVPHYNAWQDGRHDRHSRALYLVLGGLGTGKSRMLDEMKGLLCAAAEQSKKEDLMQRMRNAYVFHVTFENDSVSTGKLINSEVPDFDISYRMLYQLSKERPEKDWKTFATELNTSYSNLPLSMGECSQSWRRLMRRRI